MPTQPNTQSFNLTDESGSALRVTVSCDIVDYAHSARSFGLADLADPAAHGRFQPRIVSIPDCSAPAVAPMALTIGSDNRLYLVRRASDGKGGGWRRIDLPAGFPASIAAKAQVSAVAAAWTDDDRIALAVAVDDIPGGRSRLLTAYDLHSAGASFDKVPWQDCGVRENLRIDGLRLSGDGEGGWITVVDCTAGRLDTLFLLLSGAAQRFDRALVFSTAVDYTEIYDYQLALDPFTGPGIAVLGASGADPVLSFRPFPDYLPDGRIAAPTTTKGLTCPRDARVLAVGQVRDSGTDLYIGGAGVHLMPAAEFDNQLKAALVEIVPAAAASNLRRLEVAQPPAGSVAVWALTMGGDLVTTQVTVEATPATAVPALRLRQDVQDIAPVHGDKHLTTGLLAIYGDGHASTLTRDASTGTWAEAPLLVADGGEAILASCYAVILRLLDQGGRPVVNRTTSISASALTSAIVNGSAGFIGPQLAFEAKTDALGAIHLYDRVRSLTPPLYRFALAGVGQELDVNPANGIHARLATISAQELRDATVTAPGRGTAPLLPEAYRTGDRKGGVDGMVLAMNRGAGLARDATAGIAAGVRLMARNAAIVAQLPTAQPPGIVLAITAGPNGVRPANAQAAAALIASSGNEVEQFFGHLGQSIADFFEGIGDRLKEAWTFIVHKAEEAWQFICAVGDKVKRFVLNTLDQLGSFFTWLWQQIETGLEKLWDFLKFLFDWDDVLALRDVMVSVTDEALKYVTTNIASLKLQVAGGIEQVVSTIEAWRTEIGVPPAKIDPPKPGESFADRFQAAGETAHRKMDEASSNGVIGWIMQRVQSVLDDIVHIEGPNPADIALDAVETFITGLAGDELDNLIATWNRIAADMRRLFGDTIPENGALSFEVLRNAFIAVGADILIGFLRAIDKLVVRALDLVIGMIESLRAFVFARISFPFIEKLVELVAPGTHVDTSFRLIDAVMLLLAVPSTIAYKLITGEAPFRKGQSFDLPFGRVSTAEGLTTVEIFKIIGAIFGAFAKAAVAVYFMANALTENFGTSKPGLVLGLVFGTIGVGLMVAGMNFGGPTAVLAVEGTAVAVAMLGLIVSYGTAAGRWKNPVPETGEAPGVQKLNSGADIVSTSAQVLLATGVFSLIIDGLRRSSLHFDQLQQAPVSLGWIGGLGDSAGTILADAAVIDDEPETKAALLTAAAISKGVMFVFKLIEGATWFGIGPKPAS